MEMNYNIYADNNLTVKAVFSKVAIDEQQQFPFKIPASFKPVNVTGK